MKLSRYGLGSVCYHLSLNLKLGDYEFESKDFEDGVLLSHEEARLVFRVMTDAWREGVDSVHTYQAEEAIHRICKKLERIGESK